jgi:predicted nuclease with TOPRIM domain
LEERKDNKMLDGEEPGSGYTLGYKKTLGQLLERFEKLTKLKGTSKEVAKDVAGSHEIAEKMKALEAKAGKQLGELELLKANLAKEEEERKKKDTKIEDFKEKLEKLSRRLQTSNIIPYASIEKAHFSKIIGPHDCTCVICNENMKPRVSSSSGDSPDVNLLFNF